MSPVVVVRVLLMTSEVRATVPVVVGRVKVPVFVMVSITGLVKVLFSWLRISSA